MLSCSQLKNKLNSQAKNFELILNLPDIYASGLWAVGVYSCTNFYEVHRCIDETFASGGVESILQHESLQYLTINDVDDSSIIESLNLEVFAMAKRIDALMLKDVGLLKIISTIYEVLGLRDEAKFIVNTGADFRLDWQPYFDSNNFPIDVRYADLIVQGTNYRLIATKLPFEDLLVDRVKGYISAIYSKYQEQLDNCKSVRNSFYAHVEWLIRTLDSCHTSLSTKTNSRPVPFKIDGSRFLVFGFPLKSSLVSNPNVPLVKAYIRDLEEDQKFIVRVDQQALVFNARIINERAENGSYKSICGEVMLHYEANSPVVNNSGEVHCSWFRSCWIDEVSAR